MSISQRLAELRTAGGITQSEVAKAIGASQSTISQLEAGTRQPSYDMLKAIARALHVDVSHLVSDGIEGLTVDEQQHFREYRSLSSAAREELRAYTTFLRQRQRGPTRGSS